LARRGAEFNFPAASIAKLADVRSQALEAVKIARKHGIKVGFGTDLLGPLWEEQSREFTLRSAGETPMEIILSATRINAEVLNQTGRLGEISVQAYADLLVLDKNPAENISILVDSGNIAMIMMGGRVYKNLL
jgi:imidazolonepropionase-like amidohydrolase